MVVPQEEIANATVNVVPVTKGCVAISRAGKRCLD